MTGPENPSDETDLPTPPPPGQRVNRYGRAGALTDDLQARIVTVVKAGNYLKVAAQYNGIGESTLRTWLIRGRRALAAAEEGTAIPPDEERYVTFLKAVTQAETTAEVAAVTHWRAAFADDWRAARDFLRYSKPDTWAPVTRIQVTPEEADRRIEAATLQVLTAVGVDTDALGLGDTPAGDDPDAAALDALPLDDDGWDDGTGD